jgi:hypothetical protein
MSTLTDPVSDIVLMARIDCPVEWKWEILKNGSVDQAYTEADNYYDYGDTLFFGPGDHWYLDNDGTDVWETRITLKHLGHEVPMKVEWDYTIHDRGGGPDTTASGSLVLVSGTVTQTFSPPGVDQYSSGGFDISNVTFTAPT